MVLFENLSRDSNTCKYMQSKSLHKIGFLFTEILFATEKKWVEMQKHYDRGDARAYPSCNLNDDDAKLEEAKSRHFAWLNLFLHTEAIEKD